MIFRTPLFLLLVCLLHLPVLGRQPQTEWLPRVEAQSGSIVINRALILQLRVPAAGREPAYRAEIMAKRLREGLQSKRSDVRTVRVSKNEAMLLIGGEALMTVTRQDAGGDPLPLAQQWAAQLDAALRKPGLSLPVRSLIVPMDESRTLTISGAAQGELKYYWEARPDTEFTSDKCCEVQVLSDSGEDRLVLRGKQVGTGRLLLYRDGASVALEVHIQPYAAIVKTAAPITIHGSGPSQEMLRRLIMTHAQAAIRALPGAQVWTDESLARVPNRLTQTTALVIPVKVTGPDMVTVQASVTVPVLVVSSASENHPTTLLYSNSPERIEKPGLLYQASIPAGPAGTRLLYHHQSHLKESVPFVVELVNPSSEPASVGLLWSQAGPVNDTVWVGFCAGRDFLRARKDGTQVRVEVPPLSRIVLIQETLKPETTISGLCELYQSAGVPLVVRIRALENGAALSSVLLPLDDLPCANVSDETYSAAPIRRQEKFTVGGPWCFIDLGKSAPVCLTNGSRRLQGDYGLTYDMEVQLINDSDQEQKASLLFEAAAGLAGGTFFIDDVSIAVPHTDHLKEITLSRYVLPAKSKRTIHIETIPLSGSNYPARLIMRKG